MGRAVIIHAQKCFQLQCGIIKYECRYVILIYFDVGFSAYHSRHIIQQIMRIHSGHYLAVDTEAEAFFKTARSDDSPIVLYFCAVSIIKIIVIAKISTFRITDVDAFAKDG